MLFMKQTNKVYIKNVGGEKMKEKNLYTIGNGDNLEKALEKNDMNQAIACRILANKLREDLGDD